MDRLLIIKIGGNIVDDETKLSSFLKDFADVKGKKILIHGGGIMVTRIAEQMGVKQQMVDGRRITDAETLKIVTMVYAGYINKNIVAKLQANHCNAMGLCGADGDAIKAHKRKHPLIDYGFAGDIDMINSVLLKTLIESNITLVMAPVTHDQQGQLLNTNADTIAQELASGLCGLYETELIFTFEKPGVLLNVNDESSVIPRLNLSEFRQLKAKQIIFAGMLPKLDNAFTALNRGVSKVIIGRAENLVELISGISGTTLINE